MHRVTLSLWTALITLTLLLTMPGVSEAKDNDPGVRGGDVYVDTYYIIPGTGEWASINTGIPDDPIEYTFELRCFAEGNGHVECLNENARLCPAAPGGKQAYWFSRIKGSGQPWSPMGRYPSCIYAEKPRDIGDQIRENILSEFQSQPVEPGRLGMQPSPHTLIGAHTNFYVEASEQIFDFLMLEQEIRIIARPTEYEWSYGDGTTYGPAPYAGGPLPADQWGEETATSHVYRETGDYQASVTVYFSAEYSINGGPFVPIDGRATVPSAPQTVSVWKSESRNVADDCLQNPVGFGC